MIRLSIGIEHVDDIIADLDQALDQRRENADAASSNPLFARHERAADVARRRPARRSSSGCVNNMPDAALRTTERQCARTAVARRRRVAPVALRIFSLPEVPRSDTGQAHVRRASRADRGAVGQRCRRPDRHRHRAQAAVLRGRALLAGADAADRLGGGAHRLDDLVVPGRACRGATISTASSGEPLGEQDVRRLRLRQGAADHPLVDGAGRAGACRIRATTSCRRTALERRRLSHPVALAGGRRRYVHQGAQQPVRLSAGPSGIRCDGAVRRVPPRRAAVSRRRERALSRDAARLFPTRRRPTLLGFRERAVQRAPARSCSKNFRPAASAGN